MLRGRERSQRLSAALRPACRLQQIFRRDIARSPSCSHEVFDNPRGMPPCTECFRHSSKIPELTVLDLPEMIDPGKQGLLMRDNYGNSLFPEGQVMAYPFFFLNIQRTERFIEYQKII